MRVSCVREGLRRLARPSLGLGLAVALYGLLVWVPSTLLQGEAPPMSFVGYTPSVVNGLTLMALAAVRRPGVLAGRSVALAACSLTLVGVMPWVLGGGQVGSLPLPAVAVGGVAAGAGVALLFAHWLESLASSDGRGAHCVLAGAALVSALVNSASALLPRECSWVVALACVFVQTMLLLRPGVGDVVSGQAKQVSQNHNVLDDGNGYSIACAGAKLSLRALAPVLLTAAVLTFAAPLVNTVLMEDSLNLSNRLMVSSIMNLAVAGLLMAVWLVPKRPPSVTALLLGFTGVFFAAVVLVWVAGLHAVALLLGLGSAAFFLITFLVMEACLEVGRRGGFEPVRAYGIVGGFVMLARVGADVASAHLHNAGIADESKTLVAVFLLVYLLTCVAFVLYGAVARGRAQMVPAGVVTPRNGESGSASPDMPASWARLARQCDRVSQEFALSQREHEVLSLIMQGRNVPAVAEELTVSRNTVQTHVRHIYEHLGVHSRQELVAFVTEFGNLGQACGAQGSPRHSTD